jgi:hypothetical protein
VEGSCEHGDEPLGSGKFLSRFTIGGFSRRAQLHEVSLVSYQSNRDPTLHESLINLLRNGKMHKNCLHNTIYIAHLSSTIFQKGEYLKGYKDK